MPNVTLPAPASTAAPASPEPTPPPSDAELPPAKRAPPRYKPTCYRPSPAALRAAAAAVPIAPAPASVPASPPAPPAPPLPAPSPLAVRGALLLAAPTATRIPRSSRDLFVRLLRVLVEDAIAHPRAHQPLSFALRLAVPAGCGAQAMRARIQLALEGKWDELAARPVIRSRSAEPLIQRRGRKARHFLVAGNHRKAWAALDAPLSRISNYEDLVTRLFPREPAGQRDDTPPLSDDVIKAADDALSEHLRTHNTTLAEEVWQAITRFDPLSQPGPSGLRPEHLRIAYGADPAFQVLFTKLVRAAITGRLIGSTLTASVLNLVPKPNGGGARPIGVGEVLRRIAGRIVMCATAPHVRPSLEKDGQAVLSSFGTAITYRRIVDDADGPAPKWVLQLDIANAFNSVHRAAVMRNAPTDLPIAAPLIVSLYSDATAMVVPRLERVVSVDRGVIQGCPMSSLLFATALAPIARRAAEGLEVTQRWYADDGHIAATRLSDLNTFFGRFTCLAAAEGLIVSRDPGKTQVLAPIDLGPTLLSGHRHLGSLAAVHQITSLGGPVVSAAHPNREEAYRTAWEALVTKTGEKIALVKELSDPQYILALLCKGGAWSRVRYHASARPSRFPTDLRLRLDRLELELLAHALGPFGPTLLNEDVTAASIRATLPPSLGGLGMMSSSIEAEIAAQFDPLILDAAAAGDRGLVAQITEERDAARRGAHQRRQQRVKDVLPATLLALFLDLADGSGTNVLSINPTPRDGSLLPPLQASIFLALLLGLPVLPLDHRCQHCRRALPSAADALPFDPYGSHYTGCCTVATTRHNRIRDVLACLLRRGLPHASVVTEKTLDSFDRPVDAGRGLRPVDIGYYLADEDRWVLLDITVRGVSHRSPPPRALASTIASRLNGVRESPVAVRARRDKANAQRQRGYEAVAPLAFGAYGGVDSATREAFRMMTTALRRHDRALSPTYIMARTQYAIWSVLTTAIARRRTADPTTTLGRAGVQALPRLVATKRERSPVAGGVREEAINNPLSRPPTSFPRHPTDSPARRSYDQHHAPKRMHIPALSTPPARRPIVHEMIGLPPPPSDEEAPMTPCTTLGAAAISQQRRPGHDVGDCLSRPLTPGLTPPPPTGGVTSPLPTPVGSPPSTHHTLRPSHAAAGRSIRPLAPGGGRHTSPSTFSPHSSPSDPSDPGGT